MTLCYYLDAVYDYVYSFTWVFLYFVSTQSILIVEVIMNATGRHMSHMSY